MTDLTRTIAVARAVVARGSLDRPGVPEGFAARWRWGGCLVEMLEEGGRWTVTLARGQGRPATLYSSHPGVAPALRGPDAAALQRAAWEAVRAAERQRGRAVVVQPDAA